MVVGSKATRFFATAIAASNPLPLPPPQGIANLGAMILLHPDLVQAPQMVKFGQVAPINPLVRPLVLQLEALPGL